MTELFNIIELNSKECVFARELHSFLDSKERFSKWFDRMLEYGFVEDEDYTLYQKVHPQNKQFMTDYYVTVDMGKELSMLARNEKGKQARQYFIEVEKRARELSQPKLPQSYSEALRELATTVEQNEQLKLEVETNKPKVEFYDTVVKTDDWITFKEVANILAIPELGRNNLMKQLRDKKYLTQFNKPYQRYIDQKLFKVVESVHGKKVFTSTVVSQKGVDRLIKEL